MKPKDKHDKWMMYNFANPHETQEEGETKRDVKKSWKRNRSKYFRRKAKQDLRSFE